MAKNEAGAPALTWKGVTYVRVPEGSYQAIATRYQGPQWIRAYSRWSLLVEFELLDDNSRVCAFYNIAGDRNAPKVARGSRYFKAWTLANGDMPRKGQEMTPDVFLEGQLFTVEVRDKRKDAKEEDKADAEICSGVKEIISVDRNFATGSKSLNQESLNQESGITQSTNQAINQSGWPREAGALKRPASFA